MDKTEQKGDTKECGWKICESNERWLSSYKIWGSLELVLPWAPSIVALTVDKIFSCVPMVGIRSHTWSRHCWQTQESEWGCQMRSRRGRLTHSSHASVSDLSSQLFGKSGDLLRSLSNGFGSVDEVFFGTTFPSVMKIMGQILIL